MKETRPRSFYVLSCVFALFLLFLYGPMISILVLSFQGPEGGLVFPMNGVSLHWFEKLREGGGQVEIGPALRRSFRLALVVMVLTVTFSVLAGLAFRRGFRGATLLLYVAIASLIAADRRRLLDAPKAGPASYRLFELLPMMPRFTIERARQKLDTTFPTATAAVRVLENLGILQEKTGQKKNRHYSYQAYIELLSN